MLDPDRLQALRNDWKAGILSLRLMRIKHGLQSDDQVAEIAASQGWGARNLRDAIDRGATSALIDRTVAESCEVKAGGSLVSEQDNIDRYSQILAGVMADQRQGINRGRNLAHKLLQELEEIQPVQVDENAIKTLAAQVAKHQPELAEHLLAHVGPVSPAEKLSFLGKRIGMFRNLSDAHSKYIGMEREVWGLNKAVDAGADSFDDAIGEAQRLVEEGK